MAQKKGLVLNEFDDHSLVDALKNAFEIKKEDTNQPFHYVEASRSLVIKEALEKEQEETTAIEEETLSMLEKLIR